MSDLAPDGWDFFPLGDICNVAIGGTPSRGVPEYWDATKEKGSPWVSIRDLKKPWVFDTAEYITDAGVKNSNVKLVTKGTVLMSFKLSVGRVAIAGRELYTNEAIAAFLPKKKNTYSDQFLYQGLQHWNLLENIDQAVKGVTLNKEKISQIEALLPPLPEQQKIATILSSVDKVIETTRAQIDKLKDLKTGMMQELLTKGVGLNGVTHTEFKDSPVGRIPVDWEVATFADVFVNYAYGPRFSSKDYSEDGNVRTIRGTDIKSNGEINYLSVPKAKLDDSLIRDHALKNGDLVMITTADCGASAVFKEQKIRFIASAYAIRLRPSDIIEPEFIKFFMQTSLAKKQIESFVRKGTVANLPGSDVMKLIIAVPSLVEQKRISEILASVDSRLEKQAIKVSTLENTKKALMQDLLTGKVRVKIDDKEKEPAVA